MTLLSVLKSFDKVNANTTPNSCGKIVYRLNDVERLKRFLFLGSEENTLYITKETLTIENLVCLENLINQKKYTDILDCLNNNKSYKKDYPLYVLARCCSIRIENDDDRDFKTTCFKTTSSLCTIPTNLFMFIEFYEKINKTLHCSTGWNKHMKTMVSNWYNNKPIKELMYHITKYQNRNNWTHKDVLRLTHVKNSDTMYNYIYKYITSGSLQTLEIGWDGDDDSQLNYLSDFEHLKTEENLNVILSYIEKHNFVREHVPTKWLNEKSVWETLLPGMPIVAVLRNLNKMTQLGLFDSNVNRDIVLNKLKNHCNNLHPLQILIAIKMYSQGHGKLGKLEWTPDQKIVGALDETFYKTFDNVKPTNKRYLLALDVSGSMSMSTVCGINCLSAAEVTCAMAMIYDKIESSVDIMAFSDKFIPLNVSCSRRLDDNLKTTSNVNFGYTNCSLPMMWASSNNKKYDCIIIFTDSETNFNTGKPSDELIKYRSKMNINTKFIVCALSSNGFTLADPEDSGMLDICGFSSETHQIVNDFITN